MGRFFRVLLLGLLLALLAAAAYIVVSDVPAPTRELVQEVPKDVLFPEE